MIVVLLASPLRWQCLPPLPFLLFYSLDGDLEMLQLRLFPEISVLNYSCMLYDLVIVNKL